MCSANLGDPDGFAMLHSRLLHALTAAVLGLLALTSPGRAQTPDASVFRVSSIPVDATAADAVTARRQALLEGQRAGLEQLLRRLVPAEEVSRLPAVGNLNIEHYVQNFEIADEELSPTRYLAKLTVSYDPQAVGDLLRSEGLAFAETPSVPVVVLPVYAAPEGARLWPDNNPWWEAWAGNLDLERLLRLVMPLGDLEDISTLTVEQVQARDRDALAALARRYNSEDVLIVTATPLPDSGTGTGPPAVQVAMERVGKLDQTNPPETLRAAPGQTLEDLLAEAVRGLQASLDERWKDANLLRFDQAGLMVVDIPIAGLADWVRIHRGLQSLPEVSQVEIATFARDKVRAQIRYIGDQLRLEQAFARLGLALSREGESWLLLPTGGNPNQGEPPSATSTAY
jgi:hypothetical protein